MNRRFRCFLILGILCFSAMTATSLFAQVNYSLEGLVTVRDAKGKLSTDDGRVFKLDGLPFTEMAKYDGKTVSIQGSVKQADQLEVLTVKQIQVITPAESKVVKPAFKPRQRAPKLASDRNGVMTVGNVRWSLIPGNYPGKGMEEHTFQIAQIRPDLIEKVHLVLKPFPPKWIAAHSLYLFTFRDGGIVTTKGDTSNGLLLSIEAWQTTDQAYSLKGGLKDVFGSCWILCRWEDYMDEITYRKEQLVIYPIDISADQRKRLLRETITQACVNRQGEYYHTVTNNCTNNLIVLLNRVLPPERRIDMWWLPSMAYNFEATTPVALPKYLLRKGLLEDRSVEVTPANCRQSLLQLGL